MTNSLKTFTAGEKIKASETNSNNQYLLDQITESATNLQTYVDNAIAALSGNFVLPGMIIALPYDNVPTGYLQCNGASLLRANYPNLFAAIGTIYGSADSLHFNLPDFRGQFLRGYKSGKSASIGTAQTSAAPNIKGTWISYNGGVTGAITYTQSGGGADGGGYYSSGTLSFDASRSSGVYKNNVNEVRPDNYAVYWIIKY